MFLIANRQKNPWLAQSAAAKGTAETASEKVKLKHTSAKTAVAGFHED
jgi:hypothetical protein